MKINTLVRVNGRIGTICYHMLNGTGGVWGVHKFDVPAGTYSDDLPAPDFLLREKSYEAQLRTDPVMEKCECVGSDFEQVSRYELMTPAQLETELAKADKEQERSETVCEEIREAIAKKYADTIISRIGELCGDVSAPDGTLEGEVGNG